MEYVFWRVGWAQCRVEFMDVIRCFTELGIVIYSGKLNVWKICRLLIRRYVVQKTHAIIIN